MKKKGLLILFLALLVFGIIFYNGPAFKNVQTESIPKNVSNISMTSEYSEWIRNFKNQTCYENTINFSFSKCNYRGDNVYPLNYNRRGNGCADAYENPVYYENGTVLCWLYGGFAAYSGRANCPNFDQEKNCETDFIIRIP